MAVRIPGRPLLMLCCSAVRAGPTAAQMIAGLKQMAVRAHSRGVKIIGATLTAFGKETYMANAWNPQREQVRLAATFELALVAPVSSSVPQCLRKVGFETPSTRAMCFGDAVGGHRLGLPPLRVS